MIKWQFHHGKLAASIEYPQIFPSKFDSQTKQIHKVLPCNPKNQTKILIETEKVSRPAPHQNLQFLRWGRLYIKNSSTSQSHGSPTESAENTKQKQKALLPSAQRLHIYLHCTIKKNLQMPTWVTLLPSLSFIFSSPCCILSSFCHASSAYVQLTAEPQKTNLSDWHVYRAKGLNINAVIKEQPCTGLTFQRI